MKHKTIYLFLALACFLGVVLIFVFDGYIGLYESLDTTSGNFPGTITQDQWQNENRYGPPTLSIERAEDTAFRYQVDNRRFTSFEATVNISLWYNQRKLANLESQTLELGAFSKGQVEWVMNINDYLTDNATPGTSFTLVIDRGGIERRVYLYISPVIKIPPPE
jgi:hypothetical protein